eukprot:scaffold5297_cov143-Skeletonema_dohrnii-CCMP3373.AAC.1
MDVRTPEKTSTRGRKQTKSAKAQAARDQEKAKAKAKAEQEAAAKAAAEEAAYGDDGYEEDDLTEILDGLKGSGDDDDAASGGRKLDDEQLSVDSSTSEEDDDTSAAPVAKAKSPAKAKSAAKARSAISAALGNKKKKTAAKATSSTKTSSAKSRRFDMSKWLETVIGIPRANPAHQFLLDEQWESPLDFALIDEKPFSRMFEWKKFQSIPLLAQQLLLIARKWAIVSKRIGRPVTEATMTRPILESFKTESEEFEEVKDREELAFPAYKSGINPQVYVETVQAWLQATPGQLN